VGRKTSRENGRGGALGALGSGLLRVEAREDVFVLLALRGVEVETEGVRVGHRARCALGSDMVLSGAASEGDDVDELLRTAPQT